MLKFLRRKGSDDWQRWGLAAGGILTQLNKDNFDALEFGYGRDVSQRCLRDWWDVHSNADLDRTLQWLYFEGHNAECIGLCEELRSFKYADPTTDEDDPQTRAFYRFLIQQHQRLEKHGLAAWDLSRLVNVARWGYTSEYISDETAWFWIRRASQHLQLEFSSWTDLGANFLLGYRYWNKGSDLPSDILAAHAWLVGAPESPWQVVPWSTPLS